MAVAVSCLLVLGACDLGETDLGELDSDGTNTGTGEEPARLCEFGSSVFGFSIVFPEKEVGEAELEVRDASCLIESYELQSVEPMGPESTPHQIVQLVMACDEGDGPTDIPYELAFTVPADEVIPVSMGQQLEVHVERLRHEVSGRTIVELSSEGESLVRIFSAEDFAGISICAESSDPPRAELDDWLVPLLLRTEDAACSDQAPPLQLGFTAADAPPILPGMMATTPGGARRVLLEDLDCVIEDDGTNESWRVVMLDWAI
ncbi:MAG: hypothetical protein ACRBN8_29050 [Nannocystales bacterium]